MEREPGEGSSSTGSDQGAQGAGESGNVIPMETKKRTKKKSASPGEIENMLLAAIQHVPGVELYLKAKFPYRWEVIRESGHGSKQIAINIDSEGCCTYITEELMARTIRDFSRKKISKDWRLTGAILTNIVEEWYGSRINSPLTAEIKAIAFKSEKVLTWNRLDFDPVNMPTPMFDEMMARTTSPREVMAWIGSLTDERSDRSQFLWIHGAGANGKSRLLAFLAKSFGSAYSSQIPPERGDKFWTAGLVQKRVVAFPDCSTSGFVKTDLFKSLTGDSLHRVEQKGKMPTMVDLFCKFVFMSNTLPEIVGEAAGIRRALVTEILPFTGDHIWPEEYDRRLYLEAPGVFYKCLKEYRELCPRGAGVPVGDAMKAHIEAIVENGEEHWETLFHKNFEITEDREDSILSTVVFDVVSQAGYRTSKAVGEFKKFLIKKGAIEYRKDGVRRFLMVRKKDMVPGDRGPGGGF